MDKWLMVVIGWGIVGPILAIGVCYVISWRMGNVSLRGCRLSGSRHCLHLHHWRLLTKTDRRNRTSDAVKSLLPRRTWPMHLRRREPLVTDNGLSPSIGLAAGVRFIISELSLSRCRAFGPRRGAAALLELA